MRKPSGLVAPCLMQVLVGAVVSVPVALQVLVPKQGQAQESVRQALERELA